VMAPAEAAVQGCSAAAMASARMQQQGQDSLVQGGRNQVLASQGPSAEVPNAGPGVEACLAILALNNLTSAVNFGAGSSRELQLAGCSLPECCKHLTVCSAAAAVVGHVGLRCGGCGLARYCCPEHQKEDWPRHHRLCCMLAKQAAARSAVADHLR
jgi:hypothetical protein